MSDFCTNLIKDDHIIKRFTTKYYQVNQNYKKKEILICLRGTGVNLEEDLKEDVYFLTDGNPIERIDYFINQYENIIFPEFIQYFQKYEDYKVIFTGHSLGGAVAEEACICLKNKGFKIDYVETFNRGCTFYFKDIYSKDETIVSHHI